MQKNIMMGVAVIATVFLCWVAYQNFVVIPKEEMASERAAATAERLAEEERRDQNIRMYYACMEDAYSAYSARWDASCVRLGMEENCALNGNLSADYNQAYEKAKDTCLKLYGN